MAAIDFPDTPTTGQVFDKWTWNGTVWVLTAGPVVRSGMTYIGPFSSNQYEIPFPVPFSAAPIVVAWNGDITKTPHLIISQQFVNATKFQVAIVDALAHAVYGGLVQINWIAQGPA